MLFDSNKRAEEIAEHITQSVQIQLTLYLNKRVENPENPHFIKWRDERIQKDTKDFPSLLTKTLKELFTEKDLINFAATIETGVESGLIAERKLLAFNSCLILGMTAISDGYTVIPDFPEEVTEDNVEEKIDNVVKMTALLEELYISTERFFKSGAMGKWNASYANRRHDEAANRFRDQWKRISKQLKEIEYVPKRK